MYHESTTVPGLRGGEERAAAPAPAPENELEALRAAAERGDAKSQFQLGMRCARGVGLPQDAAGAARWFKLAAAQKHPEAMYWLGILMDNGNGIPCDHAEAHRLIEDSAAAGFGLAKNWLERNPQVRQDKPAPAAPPPKKLTVDDVEVQDLKGTLEKLAKERKTEQKVQQRSTVPFMVAFVLVGVVSGQLLRSTYQNAAVAEHFDSVLTFSLYMSVLGGVMGFLLAMLLSGFYQKVKDPLLLYGLALLLPLAIYLLSNVVFVVVTFILSALVIIIVLYILASIFL